MIRYNRIGVSAGRPIDLIVTAESYQASSPGSNGLKGQFGSVYLDPGTSSELTFSFRDSSTDSPVVLDSFYFSVADLDFSSSTREVVRIGGYESYFAKRDNDMIIESLSDGRLQFTSKAIGVKCDNPADPMNLVVVECSNKGVVDQSKRAATFLFTRVSSFVVGLEVTTEGQGGGRNFMFSGRTSLVPDCSETTTTTTTTTLETTTMTTTAEPDQCLPEGVDLDFTASTLAVNNLGGMGPGSGEAMMRFSRVGTSAGKPFDLVVTSANYGNDKPDNNKIIGGFGMVSIGVASSADLTFTFRDSETDSEVTLDSFFFSVSDLDYSSNTKETLVSGDQDTFILTADNDMVVESTADGRKSFTSNGIGKKCDNPSNPLDLKVVTCQDKLIDQKKRTVMFVFSHRSSFGMTFQVSEGTGGRNFMFAGRTNLATPCPRQGAGLLEVSPISPSNLICVVNPTPCQEENNKLQKRYEQAYKLIVRQTDRQQALVEDTSCQDATLSKYKIRLAPLEEKQTQLSDKMTKMVEQMNALEPELEGLKKAQKELKHHVVSIEKECKASKVVEKVLEKTEKVIKKMDECVSVGPDSFQLPQWVGKWITVDLDDSLSVKVADAKMHDACVANFGPTARPAEVSEIDTGSVQNMPKKNTAGVPLLPTCPRCGSKKSRVCWDAKRRLVRSTRRDNCDAGTRAVMCVYTSDFPKRVV